MVPKGNPDILSFTPRSPVKWIPSRFPNEAPVGRDTCLQGIFTSFLLGIFVISCEVHSKWALTPGPAHGFPSEREKVQ